MKPCSYQNWIRADLFEVYFSR